MLQVIYLMRLMLLSKDAEAGTNINSLFGNINNNPNSTKYLVWLKPYATSWYFTARNKFQY
jgi:hypothetical protein